MTDDYDASIKQKALTIANTLLSTDRITLGQLSHQELMMALVHVVQESEAFKQEVSDAIEFWANPHHPSYEAFAQFIIPKPKPDPLVEVLTALDVNNAPENVDDFRAALDALGFEIREKGQ
jgi:hypothetical protein